VAGAEKVVPFCTVGLSDADGPDILGAIGCGTCGVRVSPVSGVESRFESITRGELGSVDGAEGAAAAAAAAPPLSRIG
jgi:hypothetical protein